MKKTELQNLIKEKLDFLNLLNRRLNHFDDDIEIDMDGSIDEVNSFILVTTYSDSDIDLNLKQQKRKLYIFKNKEKKQNHGKEL